MLETINASGEAVAGMIAVAVALIYVGRAVMSDARLTKRWSDLAGELEGRVALLERTLRRQRARVYQLEGILRAAGLPIPPWPDPEHDPDDTGPVAVVRPDPRSTP